MSQLTSYLLQFHQVNIPSVGTISLVQQPAQLDIAAKQIYPPFQTIHFTEDGRLTRHQLYYLGTQLQKDEWAARNALYEAGEQLKESIKVDDFVWPGIGTFTYENSKINFLSQQHSPCLQPVVAERVLREGVQHEVRVGNQLILADGQKALKEQEEHRWNWSRLVGWAIVILSLFFIIFYLYQNDFNAMASGLHQNVDTESPGSTYRE